MGRHPGDPTGPTGTIHSQRLRRPAAGDLAGSGMKARPSTKPPTFRIRTCPVCGLSEPDLGPIAEVMEISCVAARHDELVRQIQAGIAYVGGLHAQGEGIRANRIAGRLDGMDRERALLANLLEEATAERAAGMPED
jgi:hypothetical protein